MISLKSLFEEKRFDTPIAIFMAGSAGSGKSTFRRKYIDPLGDFSILNIDDEYEPLLKKAGLPLDFRKYSSPEQLSTAAIAMSKAQKIHRQKYQKSISKLDNIIIDGTGASFNEVSKKKAELEELGYKTMMALIIVPPDVALYRNIIRGEQGGRTLMPSIILRSWSSLFDNIDKYRNLFKNKIVVYKGYEDKDIKFATFNPNDPEVRKAFFDPFKVKGKEKSEDEKKKSLEKIKTLNQTILSQIKKMEKVEFDDPKNIQIKLNRFINA